MSIKEKTFSVLGRKFKHSKIDEQRGRKNNKGQKAKKERGGKTLNTSQPSCHVFPFLFLFSLLRAR